MNDCPIGPLVAPLSLYTILPSIFLTGNWYNYSIYNMVKSEEKLFLTLGRWLWSSARSVRNSKFLLPATRILGGLWASFHYILSLSLSVQAGSVSDKIFSRNKWAFADFMGIHSIRQKPHTDTSFRDNPFSSLVFPWGGWEKLPLNFPEAL